VLSSNIDIAIDKRLCFAAEVGLAGEVRPVTRVEQRILEAEKLGFTSIVISKYCKIPKNNFHINIIKVAKVHDVVHHLFG
jgi:DNA repair protein RadA/Sms